MNTIEFEWQRMCGDIKSFTDLEKQIFFAGVIAMRRLSDGMTKMPEAERAQFLRTIDEELLEFCSQIQVIRK